MLRACAQMHNSRIGTHTIIMRQKYKNQFLELFDRRPSQILTNTYNMDLMQFNERNNFKIFNCYNNLSRCTIIEISYYSYYVVIQQLI